MATPTYTYIDSITLGSSASSVTFSSIPQAYRDLVITSSLTGSGVVQVRFNGNSSNIYSRVFMYGNGTSAVSNAFTSQTRIDTVSIASVQMSFQINLLDANATDKHKTLLYRGDETGAAALAVAGAGRADMTDAITSITLTATTFDAGATFALYGIAG